MKFYNIKPKVLLINPNKIIPPVAPLGLEYVASALAMHDIESVILDFCFEPDAMTSISELIKEINITCIGITIRNTDNSCFPGSEFFLPEIRNIVETIRKTESNIPIVLGGAGFSAMPMEIMKYCLADFGIIGNNPKSLPLLVKQLIFKSTPIVPGLITLSKDGKCRRINSTNTNSLIIKRNLEMNKKYFSEGGIVGIETKSGCSYSCIYCIDPIGKSNSIILRDPVRIADEIVALFSEGITRFHICDSEFNNPLNHSIDVCKEIFHRKLGGVIEWYCYMTPASMSNELAYWLKKSGCKGVVYCTEHCDDTILKILNKEFTFEDVKLAAKICNTYGIPQLHSLLLGAPGEDHTTAKHCIDRIKEIDADIIKVSIGIRVYPYTKLALMLRQKKLHLITDKGIIYKDYSNLVDPVFYISESLWEDKQVDSYIKKCISSDERFRFFQLHPQSTTPVYYYDWMKLEALNI